MAVLTATTPKRFIRLKQVRDKVSLSQSEIYRRVAEGTFPKQISLGARAVAWIESDIDAWIEEQIANNQEQEERAI